MNIENTTQRTAPDLADLENLKQGEDLQKACRDFEGFFLSIILKEGLRPGMGSDGESSAESGATLQEFAVEQTAYQLGATGSMGLADLLYAHMSQNLERGSSHD